MRKKNFSVQPVIDYDVSDHLRSHGYRCTFGVWWHPALDKKPRLWKAIKIWFKCRYEIYKVTNAKCRMSKVTNALK